LGRFAVKKRLIFVLFLVLLIGVAGMVYWGQHRQGSAELYYSGTIESTKADIGFQVGGRVKEVLTDEGRAAAKGELLARLDPEEFAARRSQAQANLAQAGEGLKQAETALDVNRRVLPAEVERAQAAVKSLNSQLAEVETGLRTQEVERARLAVEATRVSRDNAARDRDRYEELFGKGVVAERTRDTTRVQYETALREHERAVESYKMAKEGSRREQIDTARSRLAEGQALLKLAQSNLKKIDAAAQEVEAARAREASARAALQLAEIQLAYTELRAPFSGIVVNRALEPGEVVSAGQEVLSVADLSTVDLKVFVGETEIGKVKPGQRVDVKTDTFPDKVYAGTVAFISPEAEFTPKIIQTHKERVKLVYLVKIAVPNPDIELKSGMPADAWFR
jgi:HlyD family secretion protein